MKKILIFILIANVFSFASAADWSVPDLGFGKADLKQVVEHRKLGRGIDFYQINRGESVNEGYLLSSGSLSNTDIKTYASVLNKLSLKYAVENAPETAPNDKAIGKIIRLRGISNKNKAETLVKTLKKSNLNFSVRYSAEDGYQTNGPFKISILRVDLNQYKGKINSILANDKVPTAETVTSMAKRSNALAAINGGFFAFNNKVGDNGAPAGLYVKDGELLREASNQRPAVIIDNTNSQSKISIVSSVTSEISLNHNGIITRIDGLNRKPGVILNCGGYGDTPTTEALHDFVCTDKSEIIIYNQAYGSTTPMGEGVEVAINQSDKVVSINNKRGRKIKAGKRYLQLTGDSKLALKVGDTVSVETKVFVGGVEVKLKKGLSMINAGPV
ncbi:MAG: phosphodiester glycosidase family protein [Ostreibacterium sp.]